MAGKIQDDESLISFKQKYQILSGNGAVIAELENNTYAIYGTINSGDINSIKICMRILYSLINISDIVLSSARWLNAEWKQARKTGGIKVPE